MFSNFHKVKFSIIKENVYRSLHFNENNHNAITKYIGSLDGISYVRSNREIAFENVSSIYKASNLGSTKHSGCEIIFNGDFDNILDIDAKKNKVHVSKNSDIYTFFEKYINKVLKEMENRNKTLVKNWNKIQEEDARKSGEKIIIVDNPREDVLLIEDGEFITINKNYKEIKKNDILRKIIEDIKENVDSESEKNIFLLELIENFYNKK